MSSHDTSTPAGAYRRQDGHAVFSTHPDSEPHPQWRLPQRADGRYSQEDVRVLWGEAVPIDYPHAHNEAYARYHEATELVLIAEYGFIVTLLELSRAPDEVEKSVRRQVSDS